MEPDSAQEFLKDPGSKRFFVSRLSGPLAYLRDLVPDGGGGGPLAGLQGAQPGGTGPRGGASVLKRFEREFGQAPALELRDDEDGSLGSRKGESASLSEKRYVVEGEIATGGMGRILNVYDQDIRRRVAMKVLRRDTRGRNAVTRFLEEAQATGQLEHPNIAPIYDLGFDDEHGVFFTMKLVRGRNLKEILRDLSIGRPETRRQYTLTRLIQILQQVAMGVHYAHVRGVIHRDLKPQNVMVGDFGETLVMDWGLAKITTQHPDSGFLEEPIDSERQEAGENTVDGTVSGTLAYMSPEQARGWVDEVDERTDVFGLGAILYEILTYHSPYEGVDTREVLAKAGACEIVAPRRRAPRNAIPQPLEEICSRALSAGKEDRYPDAKSFHEDLQVFLDGSLEAQRRQREAGALTRQGQDKAREYRRLAEVEAKLRREEREMLETFEPHDSPDEKIPAWEIGDRADETRQRRIRVFNEATAFLQSAIHVDEGHAPAKETLAGLYWLRFEEAERNGNTDDMIIYRGLVERYDEGKFARLLAGVGRLTLDSDPTAAEVEIVPLVERGRRLVEDRSGEVVRGTTPLDVELPIGHYVILLGRPDCRETRYPVLIERCGRHRGRVRLYTDEEIGEGFVYMPASECSVGGDPDAPGSLPAGRRYIADLCVGRFPVTFREYCAFLDDLRRREDPDLEKWLPRTEKEGVCVRLDGQERFEPDPDVLEIDPAAAHRYAPGFEWDLPVFAVSWFAALRYSAWLGEKLGRTVRLLRDCEWEKAARGVAGSLHPWGDRFDWSFFRGGLSRPERSQPEPVGAFAADASVYGVQDLAGSIREWCEDWFLEKKYRLTRGGGWYSIHEGAFRAAYRQGTNPAIRSSLIGFRVATELPSSRKRV